MILDNKITAVFEYYQKLELQSMTIQTIGLYLVSKFLTQLSIKVTTTTVTKVFKTNRNYYNLQYSI